MIKKLIAFFSGSLLVLLGMYMTSTKTVEAVQNNNWNHPTPTVRPTNTPIPTPTTRPCFDLGEKGRFSFNHDEVVPCSTPTPTPTIDPCLEDGCPTITPTLEITPTPVPQQGGWSPRPQGEQSTTNPPQVPTCTVDVNAPILGSFKKTSSTSVLWGWWASLTEGIEKQWVEYGYSKGNYPYNVFIPTNVTGFEIGSLDPKAKQNWSRVCVSKNGCVKCSNDLDP